MRDLLGTLSYAFNTVIYSVSLSYGEENPNARSRYMVIPIKGDKFEIPLFALYAFNAMMDNVGSQQNFDELAVKLNFRGQTAYYKSMDASLREALLTSYSNQRMYKLPTMKNSLDTYYASQGAIFDSDFNPIVLMSWEMEREYGEDGNFEYKFIRPLLRVIPDVVINKKNALERYINNKILPSVLSIYEVHRPRVFVPHFHKSNNTFQGFKVKVVIDRIPFMIRNTDIPSISTTNRELLDVALNHIEEVTQ